jgi:hypothetical protein
MMYRNSHLSRLHTELNRRTNRLSELIGFGDNRNDQKSNVDGVSIRLAIGDLQSILKEIGKLR